MAESVAAAKAVKPAAPKAQLEKEIQKACLDYLRVRKILCWKNRAVGISKPNGSFIPIPKNERGVSDIIGCLPSGRLLAIEVKRPGTHPTAEQEAFIATVNLYGGLAFVARSIEDIQAQGI